MSPSRDNLPPVKVRGGDLGAGPGSGDGTGPIQRVCIKDFPSKARFTARMVAISSVDPDWHTYNRAERRRLAAKSRLKGRRR